MTVQSCTTICFILTWSLLTISLCQVLTVTVSSIILGPSDFHSHRFTTGMETAVFSAETDFREATEA